MEEGTAVVLQCEKLCKNFGKKNILHEVSVKIEQEDILGFIGPNGAGKTTTIKLILGLQAISSGTVKINGYDIQKDFTNAIKKVGAIVENPDLYMYLTGYENLKMIANLYKTQENKKIGKERIEEVIKLVGLENRIHDKVSKYSLGMRQRLGIAQAILHKPNLLILDEPTNGLDPEGIKEIRELIQILSKKEKMAVFISSHNLSELESFCNKVCIIKNGIIIETSKIEDVKNSAKENKYSIEINDTKLLENTKYNVKRIDDTKANIEITKEEVPELIKELVEKNAKIYSVKEEQISLEDAFLKKTGGNIIE